MRMFTLAEANALLEQVRPLAEQLVERKHALDEAERERAELLTHISGNGGDIAPGEVAEAAQNVSQRAAGVAETIEELQGYGVQIKDLDLGLLDFPSERDGEEILFCWQLGEDEIRYWHGPEEGYSGRKPIA